MQKNFVAINYIDCEPDYTERFEFLFGSRAKAIDMMPGFIDLQILKPSKPNEPYLIVSHWESEAAFKEWTASPAFVEGHKRGFEDIRKAIENGQKPPMKSNFKTYQVIAN